MKTKLIHFSFIALSALVVMAPSLSLASGELVPCKGSHHRPTFDPNNPGYLLQPCVEIDVALAKPFVPEATPPKTSSQEAQERIYYIAHRDRPNSPAQLNPQVLASLDDLAVAVSAWNSDVNLQSARNVLIKRVQLLGIERGLYNPTMMLFDAMMLGDHRDLAATLIPAIARLKPSTGSRIINELSLDPIDRRSARGQQIIDAFNDPKGKSELGADALSTDYRSALSRIDPSGIAAAIFGPNSRIYRDLSTQDQNKTRTQKSPIFGLTRDDIEQCAKRCGSFAVKTAETGGKLYGHAGAAIGAFIGQPESGKLIGEEVGTATSFAGGILVCTVRHCGREASASPTTTAPASTTPSQTHNDPPPPKTENEPTAPPASAGGADNDGSHGSGHTGGPGNQCDDDGCTMDAYVNPDADPSNNRGGGSNPPSDTGTPRAPRGRPASDPFGKWVEHGKSPFVYPVRPDGIQGRHL